MSTQLSSSPPLLSFDDSKELGSVHIRSLSDTSSDDFASQDSSRPNSRDYAVEAHVERFSSVTDKSTRHSHDRVSLSRFFDHVTGHHKELADRIREAQTYKDELEQARLELRREAGSHISTREHLASAQRMNEKLKYDLASLHSLENHKNSLLVQLKSAEEQNVATEQKLQRARDMYSIEHRTRIEEKEQSVRVKEEMDQESKIQASRVADFERAIKALKIEHARSQAAGKKSEQETKDFRARVDLLDATIERLMAGKADSEAQIAHLKAELDAANAHVCQKTPAKRSPVRGQKGDVKIEWVLYDDKMVPENEFVQYHADRWVSPCVDVKAYTWDLVVEEAVGTENGFYVDPRALGASTDGWSNKTMTVAYKIGNGEELYIASAQRYGYLKLDEKPCADERSTLPATRASTGPAELEVESPCRKMAAWWLVSTAFVVALTFNSWVPSRSLI